MYLEYMNFHDLIVISSSKFERFSPWSFNFERFSRSYIFITPGLLTQCFIHVFRFNIQNYGAVGDGDFNNTNAFNAAIRAASSSGLPYSTVLVPYGEYVTSPIELEDCKNTWIVIQVSTVGAFDCTTELGHKLIC